jgi:hypothetical protein
VELGSRQEGGNDSRDTFLGAEGTRFMHGDRFGRSMYLPPNSASNAMFLTILRYLLIQDWEDDEGNPDMLRLLFAAPGRWLEDGAVINVEHAPTRWGKISFRVESRLSQGEVRMTVTPPSRHPAHWLVRLPLPVGWKVASADVDDTAVSVEKDGAVDLSKQTGRLTVRFKVQRVESKAK